MFQFHRKLTFITKKKKNFWNIILVDDRAYLGGLQFLKKKRKKKELKMRFWV